MPVIGANDGHRVKTNGSTALAHRFVYVLIGLVVVTTAALAAYIVMDHPWVDSLTPTTEQTVTLRGPVKQGTSEQAASTQPAVSSDSAHPTPESLPAGQSADSGASSPKPNTETKGDRLMASTPPPGDPNQIGPPSVALESARQYLAAPSAGAKFRSVMRVKPIPVLLDDKQIASIKQRLKLTSAQERYWPPVESALRDLVLYMHSQRSQPISKVLDPSNDPVKRMMTVGMPFLAQLREDQKSQIQALARMAGLGTELPGLKAAQN